MQWEPSCFKRTTTNRRADGWKTGHDEANSRFSQFCERAYKSSQHINDYEASDQDNARWQCLRCLRSLRCYMSSNHSIKYKQQVFWLNFVYPEQTRCTTARRKSKRLKLDCVKLYESTVALNCLCDAANT